MRKRVSVVLLMFIMVFSLFAGTENIYASEHYIISPAKIGTSYTCKMYAGDMKKYSVNVTAAGTMQVQTSGLTDDCFIEVYERDSDPSDFSAYLHAGSTKKSFDVVPGEYMISIKNDGNSSVKCAFKVSYKPVANPDSLSVQLKTSKDGTKIRVRCSLPKVVNGYYEVKSSIFNKGKAFNTKNRGTFDGIVKAGRPQNVKVAMRLCVKIDGKMYFSKSVTKTITVQ